MPEPALTMNKIHELLQELDPNLEPNDDAFKVAELLLAALAVGANAYRVAEYTGHDLEWVRDVADRLTLAGIWQSEKTVCNWFDNPDGGVEFWEDVCIGLGLIEVAEPSGYAHP